MTTPLCPNCHEPMRHGVLFVPTRAHNCEPLEWSDGEPWAVRVDSSHRSLVNAYRCPACGEVHLFEEAPRHEPAEGYRHAEVDAIDTPVGQTLNT